jgi:hypothetical protein
VQILQSASAFRDSLKEQHRIGMAVQNSGLSWPLPEDMNDKALEAALYANRRSKRGHRWIAEPVLSCKLFAKLSNILNGLRRFGAGFKTWPRTFTHRGNRRAKQTP